MRSTAPQFPEIRLPITDSKMQILRSFLNRFISIFNGGLFSNITTQDILTVNLVNSASEVTAIHNLGRLPRGFVVLNVNVAGAVISGVQAKWTTTTITLVSSQNNVTALIVVL